MPRQPSLSPSAFLSPGTGRKRSFGDANEGDGQPKRLSSIKSILNHGYEDEGERGRYSPGYGEGNGSAGYGAEERERIERREMLQREAERMREALKAKERELAEL